MIIISFNKFITIGNKKNSDYTISTIKPKYSNVFETGIMLNEFGEWNVVEKYTNEEDAMKGHEKYCSMTVDELDKII